LLNRAPVDHMIEEIPHSDSLSKNDVDY